ncbi:MAG: bifunctional diaminohydroxyphosphoribosylaminopyrimidine deaminase/5-amino-6-(5-phosphoribosylamino)uracil reductase RibD [Candidatus Omnitrophota bacterium]
MSREQDIHYMQRALQLAQKGRGLTSPNPMVGCVIVNDHRIIAEGWHRRCGGAHAEAAALELAKDAARNAVMYVTLEPCCHEGRTPPCVDRVIASGVRRVVLGSWDPNPLISGRSIRKLRRAGITVTTGVLRGQAQALNTAFNKYIVTRTPYVTIKCAQSLDGKIATASGHSQWITSQSMRRETRRMRARYDAILVGVNTVIKDDPVLNPVPRKTPWTKVVVDSRLRISPRAKIFQNSRVIVAAVKGVSARKIRRVERAGAEVVLTPVRRNRVDLKWLMRYLGEREITDLLIEGGGQVIGSALRDRVVDEAMFVIAPKIIGEASALDPVVGLRTADVNRTITLATKNIISRGGDILISGMIRYAKDKDMKERS